MSSLRGALQPYLRLMDSFVAGRKSADDFEAEFLDLYLNDSTHWPPEVFNLLDGLFAETDSYVADPALRADVIYGISGEDLRLHAGAVHSGLTGLLSRGD
jgi:hypothetical protein